MSVELATLMNKCFELACREEHCQDEDQVIKMSVSTQIETNEQNCNTFDSFVY